MDRKKFTIYDANQYLNDALIRGYLDVDLHVPLGSSYINEDRDMIEFIIDKLTPLVLCAGDQRMKEGIYLVPSYGMSAMEVHDNIFPFFNLDAGDMFTVIRFGETPYIKVNNKDLKDDKLSEVNAVNLFNGRPATISNDERVLLLPNPFRRKE